MNIEERIRYLIEVPSKATQDRMKLMGDRIVKLRGEKYKARTPDAKKKIDDEIKDLLQHMEDAKNKAGK